MERPYYLTEGTILSHIIDTVKKYYPHAQELFNRQSHTGVAEYYGRGRLEGLAVSLFSLYEKLDDRDQDCVKQRLTPDEFAFLTVWGETSWD